MCDVGSLWQAVVSGDTLAREQQLSSTERSVRVYKLSKSYDNSTALKEVTLKMQSGQLFALLGQNGAGKTVRGSSLCLPCLLRRLARVLHGCADPCELPIGSHRAHAW